jgi:hypothetical protein
MWYPLMLIECHRGISADVKATVSRTRRIDGRGGNTNSFWA